MSLLHHITLCNNSDPTQFLPFIVDGMPLGRIKPDLAKYVASLGTVFQLSDHGLSLSPDYRDFDNRTKAIAEITEKMRADNRVANWQNELFPATPTVNTPPLFAIERACVVLFGLPGYGIHLNGYVAGTENQAAQMWLGRRAKQDRMFPDSWDQLVAGGHGYGYRLQETMQKECEEEAGIPFHISQTAKAVGAITYQMDLDDGIRRDTLFIYDLQLPADFTPINQDGEVAYFKKLPYQELYEILTDGYQFKFNCGLVAIDFLIRHGFLHPDECPDYHQLCWGLHKPLI